MSSAARAISRAINDLGKIVLKSSAGTPVLLRDVARVELGPDERRGITELNGEGEVASGIVLQRFGVNALRRHRQRQEALQGDRLQPAEVASRSSRSTTAPT